MVLENVVLSTILYFYPGSIQQNRYFSPGFDECINRNWLAFLLKRHLVTVAAAEGSRNQLDKNAFETGSVVLFAAQIILEDAPLSCVAVMPLLKTFS
jgi:hypothetical protein